MILLFFISSNDGWPYSNMLNRSTLRSMLFSCRIVSTPSINEILAVEYNGHDKRKWLVSSTPWRQKHTLDGVSAKLWWYLWLLRWLNPTRNWKIYLRLTGSYTLKKVDLAIGRNREIKWNFNSLKFGKCSKWHMILFHDNMPSGKKLLLNLSVRHLISRKT